MEEKKLINNLQHKIKLYRVFIFVLSILLIISISFSRHTFKHKIDFLRYSLIDSSRHTKDQKHFITNIQPIREKLFSMVKEQGLENKVSIYFEYLNTGANVSINKDLKIFPASLVKLPIGMIVAKKVENGVWTWDTPITLLEEDLNSNSGDLYKKPAGSVLTVEELLKKLLTNSDNTAYLALKRNITTDELVSFVGDMGIDELIQADGRMSAKEYSRFFRSLYSASYLNRENSQKILDCLTKSTFTEYLASGIPPGIQFAHKIGENYLYNVYSDSGIVYEKDRPYMLSVMYHTDPGVNSKEEDKKEAVKFMNLVSKEIYNYIHTK